MDMQSTPCLHVCEWNAMCEICPQAALDRLRFHLKEPVKPIWGVFSPDSPFWNCHFPGVNVGHFNVRDKNCRFRVYEYNTEVCLQKNVFSSSYFFFFTLLLLTRKHSSLGIAPLLPLVLLFTLSKNGFVRWFHPRGLLRLHSADILLFLQQNCAFSAASPACGVKTLLKVPREGWR